MAAPLGLFCSRVVVAAVVEVCSSILSTLTTLSYSLVEGRETTDGRLDEIHISRQYFEISALVYMIHRNDDENKTLDSLELDEYHHLPWAQSTVVKTSRIQLHVSINIHENDNIVVSVTDATFAVSAPYCVIEICRASPPCHRRGLLSGRCRRSSSQNRF